MTAGKGDGVWTRGGTTAEFLLFGSPAEAPRVELSSFLPTARVSDGGVPLELDWAPEKPVVIALAHPMAAFRDERNGGAREVVVYSLTIATDGDIPAAAVTGGSDTRTLGVFVRPLPAGPQ